MDAKYCKKKIEEISDKVSQIHFKMISHAKLITLSQYYIDFLFQFLGSEKANMGSFANISSDMVYHPPTFDKFINYHHKQGKTNKTIEELRKCPTICYVNFYRVLDKKICYTYIEDLVDAVYKLVQSDVNEPTIIGADERISVNELVEVIAGIAGKTISVNHIDGPVGVQARRFNKDKMKALGWECKHSIQDGMEKTYAWIKEQVEKTEN